MKVQITPLPKKQWHGKEGKESFSQPKSLEVLYDHSTRRYATGLTEEEAKKYGELMKADLSDIYNADEAHPYWSTKRAWLALPNMTIFLDTSIPAEYVKWKNAKASKLVANSLKEANEGLWPFATHYIINDEEEIQVKASKVQQKRRAYEMLAKATLDQKAGIVMIVSKENIKSRSQDFIDVELDALLDKDVDEVIKVLELGPETVNIMSQIYSAYFQGILHKEGEAYFYMSELIGEDMDAAVRFFLHPDNQKAKVAILQKIR